MKYLLMLVLLASCNCRTEVTSKHLCKTVLLVGGCNQFECGVKFTDGTFTSLAKNPAIGMTMCARGSYWHHQR